MSQKRSRGGEPPPTTLAEFATPHGLDPSLLALSNSSASIPIDPQLFAMEQVVHDVQSGRVSDETEEQARAEIEQGQVQNDEGGHPEHPQHDAELHHDDAQADEQHIPLDDDEIDPALREIVNSLTNAQQSHHPIGDMDERERLDRERLQYTLQNTLEDFAPGGLMGSYNAIFNTNFPQSPSNLVLPLEETAPEVPVKRGRGRPKGSKNKPKPGAPPPPPPPPKRPRGRPPKIRTAEEEEENERRKQERALGLRKRGRPRKYPEIGLVREMRLKKNRAMFAEKIRQLEERDGDSGEGSNKEYEHVGPSGEGEYSGSPATIGDVALGQQVAEAVAGQPADAHHHAEDEYWPYQGAESLLDVVGRGLNVAGESSSGVGSMSVDGMPADTSDDMRGVFSLPDVPEVQQ